MKGLSLVAALAILTASCAATHPFVCQKEALRAVLPTALVLSEDASNDTLAGNFELGDTIEAHFRDMQAAFRGQDIGRSIAWHMERGLDYPLRVSFRMSTPAHVGDEFQVTDVHVFRRLWQPVPAGGASFSIGVETNDFTATSVSGTARVLGVDPFRLSIEVVASDGAREVPIRGTMTVGYDSDVTTCFE